MWCTWSLHISIYISIYSIYICNVLYVVLFFVIPWVPFGWPASIQLDCQFGRNERSLLQTSCRAWDKNGSPSCQRSERINHRCLAWKILKVGVGLDEKETLEDCLWLEHASGNVSCLRALDSLDMPWFGCICSCIITSFKKQSCSEMISNKSRVDKWDDGNQDKGRCGWSQVNLDADIAVGWADGFCTGRWKARLQASGLLDLRDRITNYCRQH